MQKPKVRFVLGMLAWLGLVVNLWKIYRAFIERAVSAEANDFGRARDDTDCGVGGCDEKSGSLIATPNVSVNRRLAADRAWPRMK